MSTVEQLMAEQSFEDLVFSGLDLEGADLSSKDFTRCVFRNLKLQETHWKRTHLDNCTFEDCDLTRLQPAQLTLMAVVYRRSKLIGVDWSGLSKNPVFAFEDCILRYSSFVRVNLRKTRFHRCNASDANFIGCDLIEADFSGTELNGANFDASDLGKADLTTATGAWVDPAKNKVKDLRISVESAVLLASFHGMRVDGYAEEAPPKKIAPSPRSRKR